MAGSGPCDPFVTNREMFASITFEPPEDAPAPVRAAPRQQPSTDLIIACMKRALDNSLCNIAKRAGRMLEPDDFTIKTKTRFSGRPLPRPANGVSCCAAASVAERSSPLTTPAESSDENNSTSAARASEELGEFTFTNYSPMCYRHVREFLDIETDHFRDVLCTSRWHSIPTPGKSTAQLFFCGQNWVVKTMTEKESRFLREILHRYYYHVRDNRHTLLPHFVGHHALTLDLAGTPTKIVFVIMRNVIATPSKITAKFDLKGSTIGRAATAKEKKKATCTQKDLDINRSLRIGPERKALLFAQMRRDCDFLRKADIMDYSLLLGVRAVEPRELRQDTPAHTQTPRRAQGGANWAGSPSRSAALGVPDSPFTTFDGGMLGHAGGEGQEVYYVGIIDILQEYNAWKRSEHFVRSVVNDGHQISAVPPAEYAERFVSFMSDIVV